MRTDTEARGIEKLQAKQNTGETIMSLPGPTKHETCLAHHNRNSVQLCLNSYIKSIYIFSNLLLLLSYSFMILMTFVNQTCPEITKIAFGSVLCNVIHLRC